MDLEARFNLIIQEIPRIRLVVFDFDGVFTNNMVYVSEDGTEWVRCSRADGLGLKLLKKLNIAARILSTEPNPVVLKRSQKLKIACDHGCEDKKARLLEIIDDHGIRLDEVAFVGNDINDLECLDCVGLPIAVADAYPEVLEKASYITKFKGGHGAVREVCELLFHSYNT
jgi:YrbI family 3-deoxy-D-manno-octulosonate 8-phosphate phosphatase